MELAARGARSAALVVAAWLAGTAAAGGQAPETAEEVYPTPLSGVDADGLLHRVEAWEASP
jgi:hypothetical protein